MFRNFVTFLCVIFFTSVFTEDILVEVSNGILRGRKEYSLRNITFYAFQEIPYAKKPIGELRFKEPQPAENWTGILDATQNTKVCIQVDTMFLENEVEDCLHLNVYIPHLPITNELFPVMLFIHGGGFQELNGSFLSYGPHYLMENGVILVTIDYRLGPFGFLSTGDTTIPGNNGLKDQTLALQWVHNNIKYFGGDPTRVTIFGQSAGASSVAYLLQSSKTKGLFWGAICQSGSNLSPWSYQRYHRENAYRLATYIDSKFNQSATSEELLEFLQKIPADVIKNATLKFKATTGEEQIVQGFWFTPVIEPEHESAFITEAMYSAVKHGRMQRVPLMIGVCSEEALHRASNVDHFKIVCKAYDKNISTLVNHNMHITDPQQLAEVGEEIRNIYTDGLFQDNLGYALEYFSDMSFTRASIHHAHLQSNYSDVYFYQFSYHSDGAGVAPYFEGAYKVHHGEDNRYLFTRMNQSNMNSWPELDILTSERYRALFTNFAKELNPTSTKLSLFENIIWPKITPDNFQYLDINETLTIKKDPKGNAHAKWLQLYEKYAIKPYDTF